MGAVHVQRACDGAHLGDDITLKAERRGRGFILTATTPRTFDAWTWLDEELKEVLSDLVQDMSLRGAQRKKAPAFDGAPPPRNRRCGGGVKAPPPPPPTTDTSGARHETALRGRRALSETDRCRGHGQGLFDARVRRSDSVERSDGVSTIAGGRVERRHGQ